MATQARDPHSNDAVRLVMRSPVVTVEGDATLRAAAEVLRRHDIGAVGVVGPGGLVGVLSERDVVRSLAEGAHPDRVRVAEAMTGDPRPLDADSPVWAAVVMMLRYGIRHVPVIADGDAVGMLSIRDALAVVQRERIVEPPGSSRLED